MSSLLLSVVVHLFAAFLPPVSPDDRDYYEVLGVARNASADDIRRAYKKKSLALHPDKVAQFGRGDPEAAAKEYEQVQQAHEVLSNPNKRQRYHTLQCSPTRYRFVESGNYQNPAAWLENLATATPCTRLRLIVLIAVFLCLLLLQPILVAAKVNQILDDDDGGLLDSTKWTVILIPLWFFHGMLILLLLLSAAAVAGDARWSLLGSLAIQASWLAGEVLMALRWDRTVTKNYAIIFVPFYIGMLLRCIQAIQISHHVRKDVRRMVSPTFMSDHILEGRNIDDLSEEERQEIFAKYIVVQVPPDVVIEAQTEEAVEQGRVESSPEYENAQEVIAHSHFLIFNTIFFGVPFATLLVTKLDGHLNASWWVVFIPLWIYLGCQFFYHIATFCCGPVSGEEIIVQAPQPSSSEDDPLKSKKDDDDDDNDNNNQEKKAMPFPRDDLHQKHKTKLENEPSDMFVAAEGSARDFNRVRSKGMQLPQVSSSDLPEASLPSTLDPSDALFGIAARGEGRQGTFAPTNTPSSNDTDDDNDNDKKHHPPDDEEHQFYEHIDEETFRAWQSAYAQAEESAMQAQSKAFFSCIWTASQLITLCLLVGKLQNDYKAHPPHGYNAMWILFLVFLVVGLCFCCCACAICAAGVAEPMGHATAEPSHPETTTTTTTAAAKPPGDDDDKAVKMATTDSAPLQPLPSQATKFIPQVASETQPLPPAPPSSTVSAPPAAMDDLD